MTNYRYADGLQSETLCCSAMLMLMLTLDTSGNLGIICGHDVCILVIDCQRRFRIGGYIQVGLIFASSIPRPACPGQHQKCQLATWWIKYKSIPLQTSKLSDNMRIAHFHRAGNNKNYLTYTTFSWLALSMFYKKQLILTTSLNLWTCFLFLV